MINLRNSRFKKSKATKIANQMLQKFRYPNFQVSIRLFVHLQGRCHWWLSKSTRIGQVRMRHVMFRLFRRCPLIPVGNQPSTYVLQIGISNLHYLNCNEFNQTELKQNESVIDLVSSASSNQLFLLRLQIIPWAIQISEFNITRLQKQLFKSDFSD